MLQKKRKALAYLVLLCWYLQVTSLLLLPNNLLELCKLPSEEIDKLGIDFSQLTLVTGGSIFTASNTREVLAKTGAKAVAQGYGSTEAGIVATDEDTDNCVPGSTGVVPRNTQVKASTPGEVIALR